MRVSHSESSTHRSIQAMDAVSSRRRDLRGSGSCVAYCRVNEDLPYGLVLLARPFCSLIACSVRANRSLTRFSFSSATGESMLADRASIHFFCIALLLICATSSRSSTVQRLQVSHAIHAHNRQLFQLKSTKQPLEAPYRIGPSAVCPMTATGSRKKVSSSWSRSVQSGRPVTALIARVMRMRLLMVRLDMQSRGRQPTVVGEL
nr:hypothetical protein Iba_chr05eCG6110 [Ipomoea batatas]